MAALFHTKIQELTTKEEQEKALKETIIKVKDASLEQKMRELPPTDLAGFQRMMKAVSYTHLDSQRCFEQPTVNRE